MKPKTKFMRMFNQLPEKARVGLILNAYGKPGLNSTRPATLGVIFLEVRANTNLGKHWLKQLGYEDK